MVKKGLLALSVCVITTSLLHGNTENVVLAKEVIQQDQVVDTKPNTQKLSEEELAVESYRNMRLPDIETLLRDTSWSQRVETELEAFQTLQKKMFGDKISVLEERISGPTWIFTTLGSVIPRQWNINISSTKLYHMDPLDALALGAQVGNENIVKACLLVLPVSKAIPESGRTTDYKNQDIPSKKLPIDQTFQLWFGGATSRINRLRATKTQDTIIGILAGIFRNQLTGALANKLLGTPEFKYPDEKYEIQKPQGEEQGWGNKIKSGFKTSLGWIPTVFCGLKVYLTHRLQNIYTEGYIKTFELLVSSDKVTFDKTAAKQYGNLFKQKLQALGFGGAHAQRLQEIIDTI